MNITYDPKTDTLTIQLSPEAVVESDEDKPGLILDYGADGRIVGLEILDASTRIPDLTSVRFQVAV